MNYQTIKKLGQGGFGIVEEVLGDDGISYARKTLVVPANLDPEQVKPRFAREVKYQSAIKHKAIIPFTHPWDKGMLL